MLLAIDVDYKDDYAVVAGVTFESWQDQNEHDVFLSRVENIAEYEPGSFYKRELPCILKLLKDHNLKPECIVVDGYVFLDGHTKAGLGKYLFDALDKKIPIVGVAKKPFNNISSDYALIRGESKKPLYVTSTIKDNSVSLKNIQMMHGKYRFPTLLKKVDHACRNGLL